MKLSYLKNAISAILVLFLSVFYHTQDTAALEIIDTKVSDTVQIHIKANFQTAAYVEVEHEKLTIPRIDAAFWKNNSIIKNAKITIHGENGEPALVSCSVLGKKILNRDCNGRSLKQRELLSGDSLKTGVAITSDMINNRGKSDKIVFMQVSYL